MSTTTDKLISQLASDGAKTTKAFSPWALFACWMASALASVVLVLMLLGVREDLDAVLYTNTFLTEVVLLLALSASAGLAAVWLSYPDMLQQDFMRYPPLVFLAGLAAFYGHQLAIAPIDAIHMRGVECTICVIAFSAMPTIFALWLMRRNASTRPRQGGAAALLAGVSLGCLGLRFCEAQASISHLIVWHYVPLLAFTLLGTYAGRRFLRW